jgi:tripartite-type tricarboxylate transporter receptor subunit TctC
MQCRKLLGALTCALFTLGALPAYPQADFPSKPIRLYVPTTAGGGVDLTARTLTARLGEYLGQQVLVENMGGGGGTVASGAVARAAPDGYTLIMHTTSSGAINAVVYDKLPYDPVKDFAAVSLVARFPLVILVNKDVPVSGMGEFIKLLKTNPGKYSYGSSGMGSIVHLGAELFKSTAKVEMLHVPYKGNSAALVDLLAGRIHMMIDGVPPQRQNIESGKVKALAVTTTYRSDVLPNVPTMQESGVTDYEIQFWTAVFAPGKTPKPVIDRLSAAIAKAIKHPETMKKMKDQGSEGVGSTPEALDRFWREERARYGKIVKESGVKIELN